MKLIDKDKVIAEIEKRFDEYSNSILKHYDACTEARASELGKILVILNALEVEEVDLEKEYKDFVEEDPVYNKLVNGIVGKAIAKHFYELGLKAKKGE